ncbi:MAG: Fe-S cluster assembly protein SufD [Acidimicrobiia bacterium]|nr:Fe-S cluster assembly protein SufD [Acidimicrobiia bacterium]
MTSDVDEEIPPLDGPRIVMVNGVVDELRSDLTCDAGGLTLSSLADAMTDHPEQLAGHFGSSGDEPVDAFVALNRAFGRDGAFAQVADDHALDAPIHVVNIAIPDQAETASCTGVVIQLGDRSAATVVETRIGGGDEFGGSNVRTTITLGCEAILEHIVLQDVPAAQIHLSYIDVTQGPKSEYRARSFNLGGSYGRLAYDVHLAGERAQADLSGLYSGFGDQILDQQITVIHGAKDCTSRQSFRGVLDDASTGVFNGGIDVRPGADGTDAEQLNDNLLLSNRAEANTQPRLEILADDVACKHGATVGQLDDTALYYLRSRGISVDDARRLLINGFADQTVDDVGIEVLRAWITQRLGHADA